MEAPLQAELNVGLDSANRATPSWADACHLPDEALGKIDIGFLNLACAGELPGAESLNLDYYLDWLDEAARQVKVETERNYYKFLASPAAFENSQARFCVLCLVTVLQRQRGVRYNPQWQGITPESPAPTSFGHDARDLFIHAIIDGVGGTCGSLPVLYVAIGRRLGYPLKLVKAARHLFVRWDDAAGERWLHPDQFNAEATGPGVHFLPDGHYTNWPHPIAAADVEAGIFLKSLSPREELAEFLATRGHCLCANGRKREAVAAFAEAARLAPHNRHFSASHKSLLLHMEMKRRGHAFLNAPSTGPTELPDGPFWVSGLGGHKVLVQLPQLSLAYRPMPSIGELCLVRQHVSPPGGLGGEVFVPIYSATQPMSAHWLRLSDGKYALIHRREADFWKITAQRRNATPYNRVGQPITPRGLDVMSDPISGAGGIGLRSQEDLDFPMSEQTYLVGQIEQAGTRRQYEELLNRLPDLQQLDLPAGPQLPRLPNARPHDLEISTTRKGVDHVR